MFLLVPAYPGCPGQTAVKWLLLLLLLNLTKGAKFAGSVGHPMTKTLSASGGAFLARDDGVFEMAEASARPHAEADMHQQNK